MEIVSRLTERFDVSVSVLAFCLGIDVSDASRYASRALQLFSFGRGVRREVVTGNFTLLQCGMLW